MVMFFTEEDLASFGSYMISKERKEYVLSSSDETNVDERLENVTNSDLSNWAFLVNQAKKDQESKDAVEVN